MSERMPMRIEGPSPYGELPQPGYEYDGRETQDPSYTNLAQAPNYEKEPLLQSEEGNPNRVPQTAPNGPNEPPKGPYEYGEDEIKANTTSSDLFADNRTRQEVIADGDEWDDGEIIPGSE